MLDFIFQALYIIFFDPRNSFMSILSMDQPIHCQSHIQGSYSPLLSL